MLLLLLLPCWRPGGSSPRSPNNNSCTINIINISTVHNNNGNNNDDNNDDNDNDHVSPAVRRGHLSNHMFI